MLSTSPVPKEVPLNTQDSTWLSVCLSVTTAFVGINSMDKELRACHSWQGTLLLEPLLMESRKKIKPKLGRHVLP